MIQGTRPIQKIVINEETYTDNATITDDFIEKYGLGD